MLGSWAGAMGQPQFMPSSFMEYAVDFTGDGRRDIWTTVPDVLASIANYFAAQRLEGGPAPGASRSRCRRASTSVKSRGSFDEWAAPGVHRADGGQLPTQGDGHPVLPERRRGARPSWSPIISSSIKRYNNSDVYALAVGQLADRMRGRGPIRAEWPAEDRQLRRDERIALQKKARGAGLSGAEFHRPLRFRPARCVRDVQVKAGQAPDGHPTPALLSYAGVVVK